MKRSRFIQSIIIFTVVLTACAPSVSNLQTGTAINAIETFEANPTKTVPPLPSVTSTSTRTPTLSPTPTLTRTPTPTLTLTSTSTPIGGGNGLVYIAIGLWPNSNIFAVKTDGSGMVQITREGYVSGFYLSPDGQQIAYRTYITGGKSSIYLLDLKSMQTQLIIDGEGFQLGDWSPDGKSILVWFSQVDEQYHWDADLFIIPIGKDPINITHFVVDQWIGIQGATWSPDGNSIAFVASKRGSQFQQLYVIQADGSSLRRLTYLIYNQVWKPEWSPDGTKIAFGELTMAGLNIWVINQDGSEQRQLHKEFNVNGTKWTDNNTLWYLETGSSILGDRIASIDISSLKVTTILKGQMMSEFRLLPDHTMMIYTDQCTKTTYECSLYISKVGGDDQPHLLGMDVFRDL